jgi:Acyclic terpene utilisation family protein AtuA
MSKNLRIGAGSAWWGDRIEPAKLNAEQGDLDYLCFETMAEARDGMLAFPATTPISTIE